METIVWIEIVVIIIIQRVVICEEAEIWIGSVIMMKFIEIQVI